MHTYTDKQYNFDLKLNHIEDNLTLYAAIPVLGIIPGSLKMLIGLVQTAVAGVLAIVYKISENQTNKEYAQVHFKHGLGNMLAAFFEAIPIIGLIGLFWRYTSDAHHPLSCYSEGIHTGTAHPTKFLLYPSLERDVIFEHCTQEEEEVIQQKYQTLIKLNPNTPYRDLAQKAYLEFEEQKPKPTPYQLDPDARRVRDVKFGKKGEGSFQEDTNNKKTLFPEGPDPLN